MAAHFLAPVAVLYATRVFPALSLAVPPAQLRWRPSSLFHGLESLPVRLR